MKTKLLFFLLFTSIFAMGQKDFDYSFFTTRAIFDNGTDTMQLTLLRNIKKESNIIKIINITNTSDTWEYDVLYLGWSEDKNSLIYQIRNTEQSNIYINPLIGEVYIELKSGQKQKFY